MKRRFPFRLGATSYVLHDDVLPNLHYLKHRVDSIELLLFESDTESNYPPAGTVRELKETAADCDLVFTVHLPANQPLGSRDRATRQAAVGTILRAIEAVRPLDPHTLELHLEPDTQGESAPSRDLPAWQAACIDSLEALKAGGVDPARVGIETLEYDFDCALPVIEATGFGICMDIGHVWYNGFDEAAFLAGILPRARSFHLHGFDSERDHKGLHHMPREQVARFIRAVAGQPDAADRVVTLEVFSASDFHHSLEVLDGLS